MKVAYWEYIDLESILKIKTEIATEGMTVGIKTLLNIIFIAL